MNTKCKDCGCMGDVTDACRGECLCHHTTQPTCHCRFIEGYKKIEGHCVGCGFADCKVIVK